MPTSITKPAYAMATVNGSSAEITMYGDVVETRPIDWWTGDYVEGDFICQDEFLEDLDSLGKIKDLTIRMNSLGGDAVVGVMIHNRLRELSRDGCKVTCIVDGIAASAGSIIMCAADTVKVNASSLVMIHKCFSFLYGSYNSDELAKEQASLDSYDKAAISIYQRKTSLGETKLSHMMAEGTYMTGKEAIEKGFADEILEDLEPLQIAASADGRCLYARGHRMRLAAGTFAPDDIPTINTGSDVASDPVEITSPAASAAAETMEGGVEMTLDELKAAHADLVEQIRSEAAADASASISAAVEAERSRLAAIDEVANLFTPEEVQAAKYGETKCTAEELVMAAAKRSAAQGRNFLCGLDADAKASGAADVAASPASEQLDDMNAVKADAKAAARDFLSKKGVK